MMCYGQYLLAPSVFWRHDSNNSPACKKPIQPLQWSCMYQKSNSSVCSRHTSVVCVCLSVCVHVTLPWHKEEASVVAEKLAGLRM